jgi:hypothetical protein
MILVFRYPPLTTKERNQITKYLSEQLPDDYVVIIDKEVALQIIRDKDHD